MSSFPGSPRLQKGALVTLDPLSPNGAVIVFQYNPDTLTRSLALSAPSGGNADPKEALRLHGPPTETIQAEVELDATDLLEKRDPTTMQMGLHPTLAALEGLLYPRAAVMIANEVQLNLGVMEIVPPEAPLTLLVWGNKRVLPVRLTEFSVTEEAFDPNLNPIRAKVKLGMKVLTYQDLGFAHPGGTLFLAHHVLKESLAAKYPGQRGSVGPLPVSISVSRNRG